MYSAYKAGFGKIISFYKKENKNVKFLNLVISDTFGLRDKRKKLVNLLKTNYKKNLVTRVISKNLYITWFKTKDFDSNLKINLRLVLNIKKLQYNLKYATENKKKSTHGRLLWCALRGFFSENNDFLSEKLPKISEN